jgi:predicted TIM-barrel fold metal-dependent hydrolase
MTQQRILSADSHVVEPPEVWAEGIDPKFRSRAPRLERRADGDVYTCEGMEPAEIASMSAAGNLEVTFGTRGRWEQAIRPGAYNPHARLADMKSDGIDLDVVYPTVALRMFAIADPALRRACFAAYNDWLAGFCRAYPDRLKGIAMVSSDDVEHAVGELHRARKLGLVGAMISVLPEQPYYQQSAFDPFWYTAVDLGMPISLHVGTNGEQQRSNAERTVGELCTIAVPAQRTLVDLIYAGVFARHPKLMVISVEHGAGWAPYLMQSMDHAFHGKAAGHLGQGRKASDYFRRNIRCTFMRDDVAIRYRHEIGLDLLLWSTDYPHRESTFPRSREVLEKMTAGIPPSERDQIAYGNTAALYGLN